jgi:cysteine synthase
MKIKNERKISAERKSIIDAVGNTPMLWIEGIYTKLEAYNPTGSIKDRMACYMLRKAEQRGELRPGSRILEVTSGNTGIAFAMLAAAKGYKFIAVMPENMSVERVRMIRLFGADLVLSPAEEDMIGAFKKYDDLKLEYPDTWVPNQFANPDNIEAHEIGIGRELVEELGSNIDALVAGTGTGGTLIGAAKALGAALLERRRFCDASSSYARESVS